MKRSLKYFAMLFCAVAMFATSCQEDSATNDTNKVEANRIMFLDGAEPSVYLGAGKFDAYDKTADQITYSSDRTVYMVSNFDCSRNYTLSINGELALNSKVDVKYTTTGLALATGEGQMEVIKINTTKKLVWLWDADKCVGFILKFI